MTLRHFVFLHGSPGDPSVWEGVVALAPSGMECRCITLPDHGSAEDEPLGDPSALEAMVAERLEGFGPNITLVGHSYGAYVAARLATRLGPQIERVIAISGFAAIPAEMAQGFSVLAADLLDGRATRATVGEIAAERWYGRQQTSAQRGVVESILNNQTDEQLYRVLKRLARLSEPGLRAPPLPPPGHVIHGRGDGAVPCMLGEELARSLPNGSLEIVDTDMHLLPLTHPAVIARRVFTDF